MVYVSDLFLLIQGSQVLTKGLTQVLLDGPYGKHIHPEKYETIVLVAQGRGIAGVLPVALHIAQIGRHDRITRRIDLQWKLDHHDEEGWVEDRLQNLIELDPHRSLFAAHLYYPRLRVRSLKKLTIPEKHGKQWNTFRLSREECLDRIRKNIDQKSQYAGHMTVLACGDPEFTGEIRSFVYRLPTLAHFTHIDFQSGNSHKVSPRDIRHIAASAVPSPPQRWSFLSPTMTTVPTLSRALSRAWLLPPDTYADATTTNSFSSRTTAAITSGNSTRICSASTSLFTRSILMIAHLPSLHVDETIFIHP
ncbi:hypothetical protein CI238_11627 [Colletotrichum incanum]|uniref:Ferric reductase NAD binding domain-containing protein n=1 Tax=Colletotrichum incanum TaxID=1573173 RepID=A0A161WNR6_COLIC|nr:hypothetical protein CI238_11627 [Colletotrichum incanum]